LIDLFKVFDFRLENYFVPAAQITVDFRDFPGFFDDKKTEQRGHGRAVKHGENEIDDVEGVKNATENERAEARQNKQH
jgi:hypothetical protein